MNPPPAPVRARSRHVRVLVSGVIAFGLVWPGLLLLWVGGVELYRSVMMEALVGFQLLPTLAALSGLLVLAVVIATGVLSAAGPLVAGILTAGPGLFALVMPAAAPDLLAILRSVSPEVSDAASYWLLSGLLLAFGSVLLSSSLMRTLAVFARRAAGSRNRAAIRRLLAIVMSVVVFPLAVVVFWLGGSRSIRIAMMALNSAADPRGILLLLAGIVLLAVVVLTGVLSSWGLFVTGAVTFVVGMTGLAFPGATIALYPAVAGVNRETAEFLGYAMPLGFLALLGLALLGAAAASTVSRRFAGAPRTV